MSIFYGILGLAISYSIVRYRKHIAEMLGRIEFAEKILGSTYNFIVLIAVIVAFISLLFIFGMEDILRPNPLQI